MNCEKQETIENIVAEMREYESTPPPRDAWLDLADRIEAAWKAEREEWSSRLADAHEVAEDFKNILTKALDTLAWLKSAESPAARGCGENGGGSSRKTEIEAMRNEKRGNAAKIREAYEFAEEFLRDYGTDWKLHNKLCDMLKSALAAPARNCDVYTVGEALRKYGFPTKIKPWGEKEWLDFCEWLVSEVEGETKGE